MEKKKKEEREKNNFTQLFPLFVKYELYVIYTKGAAWLKNTGIIQSVEIYKFPSQNLSLFIFENGLIH